MEWSGFTTGIITSTCIPKVESCLSDILEDKVQQKYFLSPKACQGIQRRANKRKKELPPMLKEALERQSESVYCIQGNCIDCSDTAGCNGKGWSENVNTIDRPVVCIEPRSQDGTHRIHYDICPTLNTAQGGQRQPCVLTHSIAPNDCENHIEKASTLTARQYKDPLCVVKIQKVYGICSDSSNSMKSKNPHSGIYEANTIRKIDTSGGNPTCNQGGMLVVQNELILASGKDVTGTLTSSCATKQFLTNQEAFSGDYSMIDEYKRVRRITPDECDKLNDYAKGWTDITWTETNKGKVKISRATDTHRYKAQGNSIAVCCAVFVLEGIKKVIQKEDTK